MDALDTIHAGRMLSDDDTCENTILVADNDPDRLRSMAGFLKRQGHSCATATNLTSALALLRTGSYSLFVCDIRIEGQASLGLLGPLVRTSPYPPMILTCGSSKWDSAREVFRRGATELLLTPHYLDRFHRILTAAANGDA